MDGVVRRHARLLVALGIAPAAALAQSVVIVPSISLNETYSDNITLRPSAQAQQSWAHDLSPAIRIDANGARLKGFLDYKFHKLAYSNDAVDSMSNSTQNKLAAAGTLEAIEKFFFIDGRAGIEQQNRSPFSAAVPIDGSSASANRIETRAAQISPRVRGQVSDIADFQFRYSGTAVRSDGGDIPDTRLGEFIGRVRDTSRGARVGWAFDMYSLTARNDSFGTRDSRRARGVLTYRVDPLLTAQASFGREQTDLAGVSQSENTPGLGLNWQPSPRTQFAGVVEKRAFGTGHNAIAIHRTPRTVWQLISSKDAKVLPTLLAGVGSSAVSGLQELLASQTPDEAARTEATRRGLEEAAISATFPLALSFVSSQPLVYSKQAATVTLLGARNAVAINLTRLDQRELATALMPAQSLQGGNLRQSGVSGSWSYKVTPLTSLAASATVLRSEGLGTTGFTSRQSLFSLALSTKLGEKITASLAIRHAELDTPTPDLSYRENAILGTVQVKL